MNKKPNQVVYPKPIVLAVIAALKEIGYLWLLKRKR